MTYKLYKTINIPFIGSTHIARYCSQGYFFTESVQQSNFSSGLRRTGRPGISILEKVGTSEDEALASSEYRHQS